MNRPIRQIFLRPHCMQSAEMTIKTVTNVVALPLPTTVIVPVTKKIILYLSIRKPNY